MGRNLVKKPTVGHLWTVSPLPLLDIGMSMGMLDNANIDVNARGEFSNLRPSTMLHLLYDDFALLASTPERVSPSDGAPPTERALVFVFVFVPTAHSSSSAGPTGVPVSSPE